MIRKLIILAIVSSISSLASADNLEELRASLASQKRDLIASELKLDTSNSGAFWKVYDEYEQKQFAHNNDAINLIKKFNKKYEQGDIAVQSMINMQAEFFRIEGRKMQTSQNYAEYFSKVLSKQDVFLFYQLEQKIDALIRSHIAEKAPLIAPAVQLD